ncbi:hypothetical protein [Acaryochloris sp. IP29b_bin.137]|uniref:hypothetical protein n=1 Tax=Acaryochloris sp. IP29b_bin.137 TaxID=2969217 RepID=UPI00261DF284|nr:hypothetical protein [Acaryochloris sp. IP29b_bin.137]
MTQAHSNKEEETLTRFLNKLPQEVAESFDAKQRQALMTALNHSSPPSRKVDVRKSFSLLGRKYYFVVLLGKDRRTHKRMRIAQLEAHDTGLRRYVSMGLAGSLLSVVVLSTAYLAASAIGINFFPQSHADNVLFAPQAEVSEP